MATKNKRAEEIEARVLIREQRKLARRQTPLLERQEGALPEKKSILIVCEGENTERSYFEQFKLSNVSIKIVGTGFNTISLVEKAKKLSDENTYDQTWCVFDADPKPDNPKQAPNFNDAIRLAQKYEFGVAFSNQAFEYWLILHFNDHQGGKMDRKLYAEHLNKYLKKYNIKFDKDSKIICEEFFNILESIDPRSGKKRRELAVERAIKIFAVLDHLNPAQEESSTSVFQLVEELTKNR